MILEALFAAFTLLLWFIYIGILLVTSSIKPGDMISVGVLASGTLFVGILGYILPWMLPEEDYINMQWSFDHWRQGHNSQQISRTLPFFLPTFTLCPQPRRTQVYVDRSRKQRKHATK
jgi:hypothetical protein